MKPGVYKHYKGKSYELVGVARHSTTLEQFVVYRALYVDEVFGKNSLWVRPKKEFVRKVRHKGSLVPRFSFVKNGRS